MLGTEVGIALGHRHRLVAQDLLDLADAAPALHEPGRGGVARVVEPEVVDLRRLERVFPGAAEAMPVARAEHIAASALCAATGQDSVRAIAEWHLAPLAVLGDFEPHH